MRLAYDPHSSTLYDATTGAAVAVLYDDLPAAERHAMGRLFAAAEGMREALEYYADQYCEGWCSEDDRVFSDDCGGCFARAALRATEPPA